MSVDLNKKNWRISIIVPTTCELVRSEYISRALRSIESQKCNNIEIEAIIVVNGNKYDLSLLNSFKGNQALKVIQLGEGNVSAARYQGVLESTGEFFCFLDDDDEFLPNSMQKRIELLELHEYADVIVTNGYLFATEDQLLVQSDVAKRINREPATAFLDSNWFASPASIFRRNRIENSLFDIQCKYFEWTYLFFLFIANEKIIRYDDSITYRVYQNNLSSASKTEEYIKSHHEFFGLLLELPLSFKIKRTLKEKHVISLNSLSNYYLQKGELENAWAAHLQCFLRGGWRYLPYTRHLIRANLQRKK